MKNKYAVGFDLHNTLLNSNSAWLKAYLQFTNGKYKNQIEKMIFKKMSRKEISKQFNLNHDDVTEEYHKNNTVNEEMEKLYFFFKELDLSIYLISSGTRKKVEKDLKYLKGIDFDKIFTRESFKKNDPSDWSKLIKEEKIEKLIYIGNDYEEDVINNPNVISLLTGTFFEKMLKFNSIQRRNKKTDIVLLSGPDKTKLYNSDIKRVLRKKINDDSIIVTISADMENHAKNDRNFNGNDTSVGLKNQLKDINKNIKDIYLIDSRLTEEEIEDKINKSNIVFLMGGNPHKQIETLNKYKKIIKGKKIIGVSAGSMNVSCYAYYSQDDVFPESHFYDGLGFTSLTIDPHFDKENDNQYNDALSMSKSHPILGLPNESLVEVTDNKITIIGEYFYFKSGELQEKYDN